MIKIRLNVIDATIIVLLVTIVVIWAALIKETVSVEDAYPSEVVTLVVQFSNVCEIIYERIEKGDKTQYREAGMYGVIEKVREIGSRQVECEGMILKRIDCVMWLKLKAQVDENSNLSYAYGPIRPGLGFHFRNEKYNLTGGEIIKIIRNQRRSIE